MYKCPHLPATVKLSDSLFGVLLRQVTVVSSLIIILDAVTWSVEVKLEFKALPLTLMRVALNGAEMKIAGGVDLPVYLTV